LQRKNEELREQLAYEEMTMDKSRQSMQELESQIFKQKMLISEAEN